MEIAIPVVLGAYVAMVGLFTNPTPSPKQAKATATAKPHSRFLGLRIKGDAFCFGSDSYCKGTK